MTTFRPTVHHLFSLALMLCAPIAEVAAAGLPRIHGDPPAVVAQALLDAQAAVAAGDAVAAVAIPEERNAVATYPIGVLAGSGHLDVARAFAEYVLGDEAQAVLKEHGFLPPS
ncbi:MAG: extracellular solute-binding protein [Planctomycetes bacterium]|nr:extracellular solute-binding protein [Planctomycetota bacterium]